MKICKISVILMCSMTAGCGSAIEARVDGADISGISLFIKRFEEHNGTKITTTGGYVFAGWSYVDKQCEDFFTAMDLSSRRIIFAKNVGTNGIATASALTALYTSSARTIGLISGIGGFATSFLEEFNKSFNFAKYGPQLRNLVRIAQEKIRLRSDVVSLIKKIGTRSMDDGDALILGHAVVQQYAQQCTIPQIETFIFTSLTSAKIEEAGQKRDENSSSRNRNKGISPQQSESEAIILRRPNYIAVD